MSKMRAIITRIIPAKIRTPNIMYPAIAAGDPRSPGPLSIAKRPPNPI